MFQLLLDTADVKKIAEINEYLPVHGVTTNPSIMAGSGKGGTHVIAVANVRIFVERSFFIAARPIGVVGIFTVMFL
jgi:fructose-6-phosphate aldolase 1